MVSNDYTNFIIIYISKKVRNCFTKTAPGRDRRMKVVRDHADGDESKSWLFHEAERREQVYYLLLDGIDRG